jgi:hypothetical protein
VETTTLAEAAHQNRQKSKTPDEQARVTNGSLIGPDSASTFEGDAPVPDGTTSASSSPGSGLTEFAQYGEIGAHFELGNPRSMGTKEMPTADLEAVANVPKGLVIYLRNNISEGIEVSRDLSKEERAALSDQANGGSVAAQHALTVNHVFVFPTDPETLASMKREAWWSGQKVEGSRDPVTAAARTAYDYLSQTLSGQVIKYAGGDITLTLDFVEYLVALAHQEGKTLEQFFVNDVQTLERSPRDSVLARISNSIYRAPTGPGGGRFNVGLQAEYIERNPLVK